MSDAASKGADFLTGIMEITCDRRVRALRARRRFGLDLIATFNQTPDRELHNLAVYSFFVLSGF